MLKTIELFAGVGGFRLGLKKEHGFEIVWSNQFEPSKVVQHASNIYVKNFSDVSHSNEDLEKIVLNNIDSIPNHDLLVGGFPCQDYSVAKGVNKAHGIVGKKGVLWWSIYEILRNHKSKSKYILLENVDRLLVSPSSKKGRDFGVMLASLNDLGYIVEWRVINAADYGMPQRRKRVFIIAYKKGSNIYRKIRKLSKPIEWIKNLGVIASAFPIQDNRLNDAEFNLLGSLDELSNGFIFNDKKSQFENTGISINRKVFTFKSTAKYTGNSLFLKDILIDDNDVPDEFFIDESELQKWRYLKGAKSGFKTTKDGHVYPYAEGKMTFPDKLTKPGRTIVTGEGGKGASRFKHVILTKDKRYRRLTPIELERLNMFPDNHTLHKNVTNPIRAFLMGNAVVVGVIEKLGKSLSKFNI